jgi:hypothetical protein
LLADSTTAHEANEVGVRGLVYFAIGLAGVTALVLVVLAVVIRGFPREEKLRFPGDTGEYPAPRIQADPASELAKMKAEDLGQLNSYGWVDRKAGVAHVPIERAIEILAGKGLPTPKERGVTDTENPKP